MEKPLSYWIALGTAVLIVIDRHRGKPMRSRVLIAAISAGIGHSLAPEFAAWMQRSETLAVMILAAFGYLAMDVAMALISDREWLKEAIKARIAGGK